MMAIIAGASFIGAYLNKLVFGIIGENITLGIRTRLYNSLIQKHIGWFDDKENAPGALT